MEPEKYLDFSAYKTNEKINALLKEAEENSKRLAAESATYLSSQSENRFPKITIEYGAHPVNLTLQLNPGLHSQV